MSGSNRTSFWSWYRHSARTDGKSVGAPRRAFNFSIGIALLIAWYFWINKSQPRITDLISKVARAHPLCFLGLVLSFILMSFRGVALDYLVYSIYRAEGILLKGALFRKENELRRRYEKTFGKDKYLRAPEICGGLSVLAMLISGVVLVFSQR